MKFELILLCQLCGAKMDQSACEVTNPFSDKVSCPILTKNSHLSNKFKDNFIFDALQVSNRVKVDWLYVSHSAHYKKILI